VIQIVCIRITVWYQSLMGQRAGWQATGILVFMALLVSTLLVRLFDLRKVWRPGLRQTIFAVWIALIFMASLKWLVWPESDLSLFQTLREYVISLSKPPFDYGLIWNLVLMALLIWQGASLANSRGSLPDTIRGFKAGILLLLLHGLAYSTEINLENSLPVLIFLALGLIATSVNRMADLIPLRGGRLPTSTGWWWAAIVVAALLLIAVSLALVGLLESAVRIGVFVLIGLAILPIILGIVGVGLLIGLIISWIVPQFTLPVADFVDSLGNTTISVFYQERLMKNLAKAGRYTAGEYLVPALGVVALLIVLALIFFALQPQRRWFRRAVLEENVSSIFGRLRPRLRQAPPLDGQKRGWNRAGRMLAAARIRRIYAGLMELCETIGSPRPPAATPLEFLPVLRQVFPDHASGADLITDAYLKVRYGGVPESAEEVEQVETAWKAIRAHGREMILAIKREEREKPRN
jgi:hypothetical protein